MLCPQDVHHGDLQHVIEDYTWPTAPAHSVHVIIHRVPHSRCSQCAATYLPPHVEATLTELMASAVPMEVSATYTEYDYHQAPLSLASVTLKGQLKRARMENHLTQQEIADFLGVTRQAYQQMERRFDQGSRGIDALTLAKLSIRLHVPMESLFLYPEVPITETPSNNPPIFFSEFSEDDPVPLFTHTLQ